MTRRNTARASGGSATNGPKPQQAPQPAMSLADDIDRQWAQAKAARLQEQLEHTGRQIQHAMQQSQVKRLDSDSGAGGGYLVPAQVMSDIVHAINNNGISTAFARTYDLTGSTASIPHYNGSGISMAWVPEGDTIPQPDVPFRQSTAAPRKLAAIVRVSNELLNDSQLAAVLAELFAASFAAELDKHALTGSGLGQPLGVLQSPATLTVSRATANQINPADIANMVARQLPQNVQLGMPTPRGGAPMSVCWVAHPTTIRQLMLNDANKNTLYTLANSGYVLKASEHLPQLGATGDLVLADWSKYIFAYRERFRIAVSDQTHFDTFETLFRITARLDGSPWLDAPITADDGYQYSPFVALT